LRLAAVKSAIARFEQNPLYPKVLVDVSECSDRLAANMSPAAKTPGTPERMGHVLEIFNICAEAHLRLVSDMASQKDFVVVISDIARMIWAQYTGYHFDLLPPLPDRWQPIQERLRYWSVRGFSRLAMQVEESIEPIGGRTYWPHIETTQQIAKVTGQPKDISDQLDKAALKENISHEEQAARIGISRTTYFEVKAGHGGRKARRSVEMYLSQIFPEPRGPNPD
jgi:hypothetical protein